MDWWDRRRYLKKKEEEERRASWELYKFQRPLYSIGANPQVLAYNSLGNSFTAPYDPKYWDELFRSTVKVYAWGRLEGDSFVFDESREIIRDPKDFPEW